MMAMRKILAAGAGLMLVLSATLALAQNAWVTPGGSNADGAVQMCLNASNQSVPVSSGTCAAGAQVTLTNPGPVGPVLSAQAPTVGLATDTFKDPCFGSAKVTLSINQTASAQIFGGSAGVKAYLCSASFSSLPLATPGVASGTGSTTGGSLAAATYYVKIVALDSSGDVTIASQEATGVTTTGTTSSIAYTWTAVPNANSYRIYFGTAPGGESNYFTSATASFTLTTTTGGTSGNPPTTYNAGSTQTVSLVEGTTTGTLCAMPPPAAPSLSASTTGGSLATGTVYVKITYTTATGETLPSAETSQAVTGPTASVTVTAPALMSNATGYNIYVGSSSGGEHLANTSATIALGTNYTIQTVPPGANAAPPATSTLLPAGVIGGSTAANGIPVPDGQTINFGSGTGMVASTAAANGDGMCLLQQYPKPLTVTFSYVLH